MTPNEQYRQTVEAGREARRLTRLRNQQVLMDLEAVAEQRFAEIVTEAEAEREAATDEARLAALVPAEQVARERAAGMDV